MGRRRRGRGKSQKVAVAGQKAEVIQGQQLFTATANASLVTIPIRPSSFTRVLAIADSFSFYRFTSLHIEVLPTWENESAGTQDYGSLAYGYGPGALPDTAISTEAGVLALPFADFMSNGSTVPRKLRIPRKELLKNSQILWFKTILGTPDEQFETQGYIYLWATINGSFSNGINLMIKFTCELQGWILAANTPWLVVPRLLSQMAEHEEALRRERQRRKLLASGSLSDASDVVELAGIKYLRITPK